MALVQVTSEDPFAGLPEPEEFGKLAEDLDLYFDDVYSLPAAERIDYARRTEAAAMAADARIQNSGGGSFDAATGRKILANSRGFVGEVRRSSCSIAAQPIALSPDGGMQRDYCIPASDRWRCWIRRSRWDWRRRGGRYENWELAKCRRSACRSYLRRRLPTRFWARLWGRSTGTPCIGDPHF